MMHRTAILILVALAAMFLLPAPTASLGTLLGAQSVPAFVYYVPDGKVEIARVRAQSVNAPAVLTGLVRSGRATLQGSRSATNSFALATNETLETDDQAIVELSRGGQLYFVILPNSKLTLEQCETNTFDSMITLHLHGARILAINRKETFPERNGHRFLHRTFFVYAEIFDLFNHDPAAFYLDTVAGSIQCLDGRVQFNRSGATHDLKAGERLDYQSFPLAKKGGGETSLAAFLNSLTNRASSLPN